ncbi:BQ5605_C020g09115 [Microbotryum silenes-dioicae]|uniref:BQ5605_C020g09115 protein n=1 Tax=Microbotryum silenes-dioicae TaxID=796604 RepID=A0A2X0PJJ5_9BASI|nr:BQ5605_C020g09115 [Microbotryum silenes-dioicae]
MPSLPPPPRPPPPTANTTATTSSSPNPLTYHITHSSQPHSPTSNSALYTSISTQFSTRSQTFLKAPSLEVLNLIADWASASEPIGPDELRKNLSVFSAGTWRDLWEERHLEDKCAWVGCTNRPAQGYKPSLGEVDQDSYGGGPRFKLRSSGLFARLKPLTNEQNELNRFCGAPCWRRSEWVMKRCLGKDTDDIIFLDEESASRDQVQLNPVRNESQVLEPTSSVQKIDLHIIEKEIPPTQEIIAPRPGQEIDFERPLDPDGHSKLPKPTRPTKRSLAPLPSGLPPIIPTTRPVPPTTHPTTRPFVPPPPPLPTSGRFEHLSTPLTFLSDPIMVDHEGQEIEWAGVDEEGEDEVIKGWMEDALRIRREMSQRDGGSS